MGLSHSCIIVELVVEHMKAAARLLKLVLLGISDSCAAQVNGIASRVGRVASKGVFLDEHNRAEVGRGSVVFISIIDLHIRAVHEYCASENAEVALKHVATDDHRLLRLGDVDQRLPLHLQKCLVRMVLERRESITEEPGNTEVVTSLKAVLLLRVLVVLKLI